VDTMSKTIVDESIDSEIGVLDELEQLQAIIQKCYDKAEVELKKENLDELISQIGKDNAKTIIELAKMKHAARGAALTLAVYKILHPEQDIRNHKSEYENGFSARGVDNKVTVPFLSHAGLPYNVESHWLSQTISFAAPLMPDLKLKTVPKKAGPHLVSIANLIETTSNRDSLESIVVLMLMQMIEERNKGNIPLTKPKNLTIDQVVDLVQKHFKCPYEKNSPRLPQVAVYAMYQCLMNSVERYNDLELKPLERMKAANRKSGTVGDIDLWDDTRPIEAVEIKYEIPINVSHVSEAIQKVRSESVVRYFILSTADSSPSDVDEMKRLIDDFMKANGCEIIVNGVYGTLKYYLRLLESTNDFINAYTELLSDDPDINYEHKVAWNNICAES